MKRHTHTLIAALLLFFLLPAAFPCSARAYSELAAGEAAVALITRYESFSPTRYREDGRWYIGYGSQIPAGAYPNGISEEDALALLREDLRTRVNKPLNDYFARTGLCPTQAQFDALADFTYVFGSAWLNGCSSLVKLVRGETDASRLETAQAFGIWCHAGGKVLPGLAERRLDEAALYLDGNEERADEFAYLAIAREADVRMASDVAVYERGGVYDSFPALFRLGYTLSGFRAADGTFIRLGDPVTDSRSVSAEWEKNVYSENAYLDVDESQWFFDYVMELSEEGVVGGRGAGRFDPDAPVTVGEAIKLALLAAGAEALPAEEGGHWASGYVRFARENALLPDALLNEPDRPIRRLDVARLAARAIGFGQSFAESPFADVDDGYVTALSELGVLTGMSEGDETVFHPDESLKRSEMSAIVWRLRCSVALDERQTVRYASRTLEVARGVPLNRYDRDGFSGRGTQMTYTEPGVSVLRGIDVSRWQGAIDWEAVKSDGIDFAMLRIGGRLQNSGDIFDDAMFEEYYAGAKAAGLRIGVYFYSQAVNTAEAVEEAEYMLQKLADKSIDAPLVFDWETAGSGNPNGRSNNVPVSVVCDCAVAYCDRVRDAGYTPMIYMNTYDGYIKYDLSRLVGYDVWYAGQYNGDCPRFIYDFRMWQYTSTGQVAGVDGGVDMDLWFFR